MLSFLDDIVLQTVTRLAHAAKLKIGDSTAVITPLATKTWNDEFKFSDG